MMNHSCARIAAMPLAAAVGTHAGQALCQCQPQGAASGEQLRSGADRTSAPTTRLVMF